MKEITQRGVSALKAGDRTQAQKYLRQAVDEHPDDAYAWLWLSGAVDDDEERIACLEQVLRIAPGNQAAVRGLERLRAKSQQASPPMVEPQADDSPNTGEETEHPPTEAALPVGSSPTAELPQSEETVFPKRANDQNQERAYGPGGTAAAQRIFRTRPSMVPALVSFWLFFFGTILLASLVSSISPRAPLVVASGGVILQLIVLYAILRNFRQSYELTYQALFIRLNGKRTSIPVSDIFHIEPRRTFWQRIRGTADLMVDAVVKGELAHLRLRDIPEFQQRIEQIQGIANNLEESTQYHETQI